MSDALLPCPWCGATPKPYLEDEEPSSWLITGCSHPCPMHNEIMRTQAWNDRRAPMLTEEEREALGVLVVRCPGYLNAKATILALLARAGGKA